MNQVLKNHPFWGIGAPFSSLAAGGLLLTASGRTAYGIVLLAALLWVYIGTVAVLRLAEKALPRAGRFWIGLSLSVLLDALFLLAFSLFSPVMVVELTLPLLLVPAAFAASSHRGEIFVLPVGTAIGAAALEAAILGFLVLALGLLREPFGFGSLTIPSSAGIVEVFSSPFAEDLSVRFLASSSGALILLGYVVALFRRMRTLRSEGIGEEPR